MAGVIFTRRCTMLKKLITSIYKTFMLFFVIGFLVFVFTRLGYTEEGRGVTNDTVKIGLIADQTGVGAPVGIPLKEATRIYFRHINDTGGINGRKVMIILEDDHYTIPGSFAAFKKLLFKDVVLSILYCGGTGQTLALAREIEKYKVPVIPISLAETMTTPLKRYIFNASASYDDGIKIIIDYIMKDMKAENPKIAIVYPDVEIGKTGLRAAEKYLPKYNMELSDKIVVALGAIDATSQVLNLKKSKPDYIILHNAVAGAISFLKDAKKYDLKTKIIGSIYVSEEAIVEAAGSASKDVIAVSPFGYWYDDTPGMSQLRKITKKYEPETKMKTRSYIQGWVTSMICAEGMNRAGRGLTPDTLVDAYETFENFSTGDISNPVSYSKNNHKGGEAYKFYKADVEKQTWTPISGFRKPAFK
ncbi:MAG: ABC transporter substrate-binding protein [Thermodesulfobacteriota bacterium]